MKTFDVIVVGLGAMGTAVTYALASHGFKVLGLERFVLNHTNGSSHGGSRIIRTAVFPQPFQVPLVQRAFALWSKIENESERKLLKTTGALLFGLPDSPLITGCLDSSRRYGLPYDIFTGTEVTSRFPVFQLDQGELAFYEKQAGILFPEECIRAEASLAVSHGALLQFNEPVARWNADGSRVEVRTSKATYEAKSVVIATGAWLGTMVPELRLPLQVERQIAFWFAPQKNHGLFASNMMPVFDWQTKDHFYYGVPDIGSGVKVAIHHDGEATSPDQIRREVTEEDQRPVREFLKRHIPSLDDIPVSSGTCMYTNTPDDDFIIDSHPHYPNVVIVSACSGHGFKFSIAIGEVVQQMIQCGKAEIDTSTFKIRRFDATK